MDMNMIFTIWNLIALAFIYKCIDYLQKENEKIIKTISDAEKRQKETTDINKQSEYNLAQVKEINIRTNEKLEKIELLNKDIVEAVHTLLESDEALATSYIARYAKLVDKKIE